MSKVEALKFKMRIFSLKNISPEPVSHNKDIFKKVIIKKGIVPHLMMFSQVVFKPKQIASAHIHKDMHETFFVEEGRGFSRSMEKDTDST